MRFVEVSAMFYYIFTIIEANLHFFAWSRFFFDKTSDALASYGVDSDHLLLIQKMETFYKNEQFHDLLTIKKWSGNSIEWFQMEIIVFWCYQLTLILLLIKSRFMKVGVDQSH